MKIGSSLVLSIISICVVLQLIAGNNRITEKVFLIEDPVRKEELSSSNNVVYPEFHETFRKRRRHYDEVSRSTLVLRTANITYYIELELNTDIRDVPVHVDDKFESAIYNESNCHFHGKIVNKPNGFVAVSSCSEDGKMTGLLLVEDKIYFLSPRSQNEIDKENQHYLQEYWEENSEFCGINNRKSIVLGNENDFIGNIYDTNNRVARAATSSTNRKIIEVAIFVDNDLFKRIEATTTIDARRATVRRVLGIMNQVQLIYNYSSLQTKFKLVVVKLQILKSIQGAPDHEYGDIDKYLDNFCVWQSNINPREGIDGHWDHAIMLTGRDLYKETRGKKNPKVLGLAWVNGMCRTNYSCTINEGTSFEAAFVIAHEIAHNLGVMHDGSGNNCDRNKFIMSDKTGPGKIHWSACSNVYINNFFGNGNGKCLSDDSFSPNRSFDLESQNLPGMKYSLSDQCILALGSGYIPHKSNKEPFNNVCRELWCASGSWAKPAHPALEGSPCDEGKLCLEGLCRSSALIRSSTTRITNSSNTHQTSRQIVSPESGGILKKIQDTVVKAIRNLG